MLTGRTTAAPPTFGGRAGPRSGLHFVSLQIRKNKAYFICSFNLAYTSNSHKNSFVETLVFGNQIQTETFMTFVKILRSVFTVSAIIQLNWKIVFNLMSLELIIIMSLFSEDYILVKIYLSNIWSSLT